MAAGSAVLGLALLNKSLIAAVIGAVVLALVFLGPRDVLRSRWFAAGLVLGFLGALPYGLWQIAHGLPQEQLANSIASSGDQGGRPGFIPFQLLLVGPLLAPIWIWGLVALLRDRQMRSLRCFAVAYLGLIPLFISLAARLITWPVFTPCCLQQVRFEWSAGRSSGLCELHP